MMPLAGEQMLLANWRSRVPQLSLTDPSDSVTCPSQVIPRPRATGRRSLPLPAAESRYGCCERVEMRACRKLCRLTGSGSRTARASSSAQTGPRSASSVPVPPEREKTQELMRSLMNGLDSCPYSMWGLNMAGDST